MVSCPAAEPAAAAAAELQCSCMITVAAQQHPRPKRRRDSRPSRAARSASHSSSSRCDKGGRSEERRVGKECRRRWEAQPEKQKRNRSQEGVGNESKGIHSKRREMTG